MWANHRGPCSASRPEVGHSYLRAPIVAESLPMMLVGLAGGTQPWALTCMQDSSRNHLVRRQISSPLRSNPMALGTSWTQHLRIDDTDADSKHTIGGGKRRRR